MVDLQAASFGSISLEHDNSMIPQTISATGRSSEFFTSFRSMEQVKETLMLRRTTRQEDHRDAPLWLASAKKTGKDFQCSSVVIAPNWAITDGSCMGKTQEWDCVELEMRDGQTTKAASVSFDQLKTSISNNIVLLKLETEIQLDNYPLLNGVDLNSDDLESLDLLLQDSSGRSDEIRLFDANAKNAHNKSIPNYLYITPYTKGDATIDNGSVLYLDEGEKQIIYGICSPYNEQNGALVLNCQALAGNLDFIVPTISWIEFATGEQANSSNSNSFPLTANYSVSTPVRVSALEYLSLDCNNPWYGMLAIPAALQIFFLPVEVYLVYYSCFKK